MSPEAFMARAVVMAQGILAEQAAQITRLRGENDKLRPQAVALARLTEAEGSLTFTEASKALGMKRRDLIAHLHQIRWIYRGADGWLAYRDHIVAGLLEHKLDTIQQAGGTERITTQARITPRGLTVLGRFFAAAEAA